MGVSWTWIRRRFSLYFFPKMYSFRPILRRSSSSSPLASGDSGRFRIFFLVSLPLISIFINIETNIIIAIACFLVQLPWTLERMMPLVKIKVSSSNSQTTFSILPVRECFVSKRAKKLFMFWIQSNHFPAIPKLCRVFAASIDDYMESWWSSLKNYQRASRSSFNWRRYVRLDYSILQ